LDDTDTCAERNAVPTTGESGVALAPRVPEIDGIVIGRFAGTDQSGVPLVDHPENNGTGLVQALSTVRVSELVVGCEVALAFECGDPQRAVILGPIRRACDAGKGHSPDAQSVQTEIDGETLTFTGNKQIVLRCGKASITLTRAGKVIIRGTYLLNRSSGVNRIKGGSVQIN